MADPLYFLNPDDKNALQQMLTWFKQRRSNLQSRSPLDLPGRSSDTYIAIPSTPGGIPALISDGVIGTANTDTPGSAYCDIYQIVDVGDGFPTIISLEFQVLVYNLSQSVLEQNWIVVNRDRFGTWLASPPGVSSSCNDIYFIIVDDGTGTAEIGTSSVFPGGSPIAQILERPCGCTTVPGEQDGLVEVASMPCLNVFVGAYGWAKYMAEDDDGTGSGTASSGCHWRIYSLCCEE